jgi:murein L,D-transpeptidase YcbB/YkuD
VRFPLPCLVLMLLSALVSARAAEEGSVAAIQHLIEHPEGDADRAELSKLRTLYAKRGFAPLWTLAGKLTPQAEAVLAALSHAEDQGLRPEDYGVAAIAASLGEVPAAIAAFDVKLSAAAARFLTHLHQGRVAPRAAGFELHVSRPPLDLGAILALLATTDNVDAVVSSVEPALNHYRLLKDALKRYRKLAAEPRLTDLPRLPDHTVKAGGAYAGVPALRTLLVALGDLRAGSAAPIPEKRAAGKAHASHSAPPLLDAKLAAGLKRFQVRHGLHPTGSLDPGTYSALTVPLAARVRQMELTLERWRWLPPFETPPIVVNIPQFRLFAFRSTQDRKADILQMDVIVGASYPEKQTPVFAADMRYVIFRPYWDIPPSILINEMLPHIRENPSYLATQHLEIVQGDSDESATPLPSTPENIDALAAGKLRLRQQPGPDNALGLIKFMFPNSHDVYLHSTPAHQLFKEARRDFSHGCIRLSDPAALAVQVLRDTPGEWTREKIEAAMKDSSSTQRVDLAQPIRVLILYATVLAVEDGSVLFFDDIYGHDRELEMLLLLPPVPGGDQPAAAAPALKAS